jgi:hypothetical protein
MKLAHLAGTAGIMLALLVISCTQSPDNTGTNAGGETDTLPNISSARVINVAASRSSNVDSDSLEVSALEALSRYEVDVKKGQDTRFCGGLTDTTEDNKYRVSFYFHEIGKKPRKIGSYKIKHTDIYLCSHKAEADGKIEMIVEENTGWFSWKNLPLTRTTGVDCWPKGTYKTLSRDGVQSTSSTGSGTTGQTEQ